MTLYSQRLYAKFDFSVENWKEFLRDISHVTVKAINNFMVYGCNFQIQASHDMAL